MALSQASTASIPAQRDALQETLDGARKMNLGLEKAAVITKAMRFNQGLAKVKYYNNTWYGDLFINDCVDNIKPVE